jgi:hypothetical protein
MMKKIFCFMMSLTLMLSLSVSVWAIDPTFDFRLSAGHSYHGTKQRKDK